MLGLPKATELKKQLPKKAIYAKFNMNAAARDKFDAAISRITIINEISPSTTTLSAGETVAAFYVLEVLLKSRDYEERTIISLTKLIPQNLLLLLTFDNKSRLAVYRNKLIQTEWKPTEELSIALQGLNLDAVWENIIIQIGSIELEQSHSLDEQIALNEQKEKLKKEIARLERQARAEKQPKKKFDLVQKINKRKKELEEYMC